MAATPEIETELTMRARADNTARARIVSKGALHGSYHPEMRAVHEANADWLSAQMDEGFWPTPGEFSPQAIGAFWTIVQHAISRPALMRRVAELSAAIDDPATRLRRAMLTDRIEVNEGRLQTYGTAIGWTADGRLEPMPIGDAAGVDARRASVGLLPLGPELVRINGAARANGESPPRDFARYIAERTRFAIETGWRD